MAEEKKTPVQGEESKLTKVVNWFKTLPARIAKPFKNMVAELRKVTWPSKKKLIASSVTVLLFMLFMGVVVGLLDLGSTTVVKALVGVNDASVVDTTDVIVDETADVVDEAAEAVEEGAEAVEEAAEAVEETVTETEEAPAEGADAAAE